MGSHERVTRTLPPRWRERSTSEANREWATSSLSRLRRKQELRRFTQTIAAFNPLQKGSVHDHAADSDHRGGGSHRPHAARRAREPLFAAAPPPCGGAG